MTPSSSVMGTGVERTTPRAASLVQLLDLARDPRARRGVRHQLVNVLALALGAVAGGARSFVTIAEWAEGVGQQVLAELGLAGRVPSEPTFRRVVSALDADRLA